jgi:flagellar protein FliO/FliZ
MNSLFGVDLPTPVNFVIAFVVVLLLIGAATWLVRRFGATRIDQGARSRQPRLAVVDAAAVDGRRKLVIIRRDNVEHLLMIGGPTDVVVETNIVRAGAIGTRDAAPARNGSDAPLRAPEPVSWQPDPAPAPAVAMRGPRAVADDTWHTTDEPMASPAVQAPPMRAVRPAETLASLAHELSRPAAEPQRVEPAPVSMTQAPIAAAPQAPAPDQSLAEMAQRLEAALRRPAAQKAVAEAAGSRIAVAAETKAPLRQPRAVVAGQPKGGAQPAAQPNNLEQEMASLLNKPGKT